MRLGACEPRGAQNGGFSVEKVSEEVWGYKSLKLSVLVSGVQGVG